jgi:hypothetical protein
MIRACVLLLVLLLAGSCRQPAESETNAANQAEPSPRPAEVRLTELTGRYEAGQAQGRLCILRSRFGLVIRGPADASCAGSGRVAREGEVIRFTMQGDSDCSFVARTSGRSIVFPASVPPGCSYYCSAGAALAGVRLAQVGTGHAEAMKTKDLVGERLCDA